MDKTLYKLIGGKMVQLNSTKRPETNNFLIVCEFGDWSGFRTLAGCVAQIPELEAYAKEGNRADGYYRIVERN